ncbi:arylsulfotransferase family protein [Candidatus Neomarinimicrobiota bacterium]
MKDFKKINLDRLSKYLFVFALCMLMYGYGYVTSYNKIFPYQILDNAYSELKTYFNMLKPLHLFPIRYYNSGVKLHNLEQTAPGVTLLTSYWPETKWTAGIRLIDLEGNILHHWEIKAKDIWPQSPHKDFMKNKRNNNENYVHGTYLYPNGDIILNVEYMGLVRMNYKGNVLWKLPYRTHHSVFRDEDGNFWVSGAKWVEPGDERIKSFPGLYAPYIEDTILKVSPDGKILKEISFLASLANADYSLLLHLLNYHNRTKNDLLHLNDVEVLSSTLSEQFPLFEKGDIVVSSNYLNLIAVLDQSGKIKWINSGLFTKQHDPDFEENGWITVFDNRSYLGKTMIKKINPTTNEIKTLYPTLPDQAFYTEAGGKHQKLDNGNRLITEARAGRVFEISPEGETVWEWIQKPYDHEFVPEVLEGTRYNFDKQDIAKWDEAY